MTCVNSNLCHFSHRIATQDRDLSHKYVSVIYNYGNLLHQSSLHSLLAVLFICLKRIPPIKVASSIMQNIRTLHCVVVMLLVAHRFAWRYIGIVYDKNLWKKVQRYAALQWSVDHTDYHRIQPVRMSRKSLKYQD